MEPHLRLYPGQQALTPAQEAEARRFAALRLQAQLATSPVDEGAAEALLKQAYEVAGVAAPPTIHWVDGPLQLVAIFEPTSVQANAPASIRQRVEASIWSSVAPDLTPNAPASVGQSIWTSVWSRLGATIRASVEARGEQHMETSVRQCVAASVWNSIEASFAPSVWASAASGVWEMVWASIGESVAPSLWAIAEASIGQILLETAYARIREGVTPSLYENIQASILTSVWSNLSNIDGSGIVAPLLQSIWFGIEASVRASFLKENIGRIAESSACAYEKEGWCAICHFLDVYLEPNDLHAFARFNELVSGYWLGKEAAIIVRRPKRLSRDAEGRLHSSTGTCIEYRDGWGVYAWHGVRVPEQVILAPERLSREDFLSERDVEVRRVIQERMGERFVSELGGVVLESSPRGTLYEVKLPDDDPEDVARYVQVQDASTPRQYFLRVPPTIQTAAEAVAWSFGLSVEEYWPAQET